MQANIEPTPGQQAAWDQLQQARRAVGLPVVLDVLAADLRLGDVLGGGGTLTSGACVHPSGWVVAEIDYTTVLRWRASDYVAVVEGNGRG